LISQSRGLGDVYKRQLHVEVLGLAIWILSTVISMK
jgi:hypothetical protein